jgi:NAD(P)-dependent dehydrogenase (short-subunit alcohol dehydrogenase family)
MSEPGRERTSSMAYRAGLVTGAGSGIGRASAIALGAAGAYVAVADIDVGGGQETVEAIRSAGGEAEFVACDITHADDVERLVAQVVDARGAIDFAHNNAGIGAAAMAFDEVPEADWDRVVAVNLKGTWLSMKYELRAMRKQRSGAVVNTASVCGLRAAAMSSPYNTTKHGMLGMTKEAAVEFAHIGVRVNAVCPGYVETPLTERSAPPEMWAAIAETVPNGRLAQPDEIAAIVLWLLSDAASYVTGHGLVADGGLIQGMPSPRSV